MSIRKFRNLTGKVIAITTMFIFWVLADSFGDFIRHEYISIKTIVVFLAILGIEIILNVMANVKLDKIARDKEKKTLQLVYNYYSEDLNQVAK